MAALSTFWDRMADRYAAQPVADEASYQIKLARTRALLRPDTDLFEFGCGTGSTAITHAPHVRSVRAIDFSPRMVEIARGKAAAAGLDNARFEVGDITTLPLPDAGFDIVLGMSILHLLADRRAVVERVFGLLRPGGHFVSSTACLGDTGMRFMGAIAPLGRALGLLPQLDVMTGQQLRDTIAAAGFAIEHDWQPAKDKAVFIIARKPETA